MSTDVLGKPQNRMEGRLKVTGGLRYSGDQSKENVAYGYLVTSTIARGEIRAMDVSETEKSPGVLAVYTPFQPLKLYNGLTQAEGANSGEIDPPLQDNKIRYYGQIIALVVADSFEQVFRGAAGEHVRELPGQVVGVAQPGGQALADERRGQVRGVAQQEYPVGPEPGREPGPEGVTGAADDFHAVQVVAAGPGPQQPAQGGRGDQAGFVLAVQ